MKQTIAVIILVGIVVWTFFYFYLPTENKVSAVVRCDASTVAVERIAAVESYRKKWLPDQGEFIATNEYVLNGCSYSFSSDMALNSNITVLYKNNKASSFLRVIADADKSIVQYQFTFPPSNSFLERIKSYFDNNKIKKTTQQILNALRLFTEINENIYGVKMQKSLLKDSTLIAIKGSSKQYPTMNEIYKAIDTLKMYATQNGAKATNPPMLNIYVNNDTSYLYMVALPLNKWIDGTGKISGKRMLAGGNILETGEFKGGIYTINKFLKELENFRADNTSISPAIPYQSLITDRSKESDTSKWITKLYYPVF